MNEFRFACPHCGQRISGDATYRGSEIVCPACTKTLKVPAPAAKAPIAPANHPSATEPKAISSLALLSLVCSCALGVGSIPAIVLGHLARTRLRRNPALRGQNLATAGLAVGYSFLFLTVLVGTIGLVVLRPVEGRQIPAVQDTAIKPDALTKRLVDEVKIGDPESEMSHGFRGRMSGSGEYMNRKVRDAVNGGFISYVMEVDPVQPMTLRCTYWGNDNGRRRFDVVVNDKVVATQTLQFNDPGRFFNVEYDIPPDLTRGKTNVTVLFQAYPRRTAGGIYGCQMLRR